MDMRSREQYLDSVREEYRQASRKQKTRLLNEARKRTRLNRRVLIRKLAHPGYANPGKRRPRRGATYGAEVVSVLVKIWEISDYPCGQRLVPALRAELERLRKSKEVRCSAEVAEKVQNISPKTVDRLLAREKQVRQLRRNRNPAVHPLLYQRIPVKVAAEWDTQEVGNLQVDYVEHCDRSCGGGYLHTLSAVDIASSWWEGEAISSRNQQATKEGMEAIRGRAVPHPRNSSGQRRRHGERSAVAVLQGCAYQNVALAAVQEERQTRGWSSAIGRTYAKWWDTSDWTPPGSCVCCGSFINNSGCTRTSFSPP